MVISKYSFEMSKKIICVFLAICSTIYIQPLAIPVISILLFLIVRNIKLGELKVNTMYFRKCSTVMYYTHMYFYFVYSIIINKNEHYYGVDIFVFCLICSILMGILVNVIQTKKESKILKLLFG